MSKINIVETIQVVLDKELLRATDRAAKHRRVNRSALVGEALEEHLRRLATREREHRDREGYASRPFDDEASVGWDKVAAWPAE